jgi:hypothetical protein
MKGGRDVSYRDMKEMMRTYIGVDADFEWIKNRDGKYALESVRGSD